jgi:hypothetical protein
MFKFSYFSLEIYLCSTEKQQNQVRVFVKFSYSLVLALLYWCSFLSVSATAPPTFAPSSLPCGSITSVLGTGFPVSDSTSGALSIMTSIGAPQCVWGDTLGNLYVSESTKIRKLSSSTNRGRPLQRPCHCPCKSSVIP